MALSLLKESSQGDKHDGNAAVVLGLGSHGAVSGGDDGKLKLWSPDLSLIKQVDSGSGAIISLAAGPTKLYTITSDQTVQAWDRNSLEHLTTITTSLHVPQKVFLEPTTGVLWIGDSLGKVAKFENDNEAGNYELTEEVWDLNVTANPTLVYTARDRDIVVAQIVQGALRSNAVVRGTIQGRYPILPFKDTLCCLDRSGRNIRLYDNNVESKFKLIREIPVAVMIVNALCPARAGACEETHMVFAGGYDGEISLWDLAAGTNIGSVTVNSCVNALATAINGVYAALADGRIVLIGTI